MHLGALKPFFTLPLSTCLAMASNLSPHGANSFSLHSLGGRVLAGLAPGEDSKYSPTVINNFVSKINIIGEMEGTVRKSVVIISKL
jgi:hypothetical protein